MKAVIVPIPTPIDRGTDDGRTAAPDQRVQVIIQIYAEVLASEVAIQKAHTWLSETVSHGFEVATPELMIDEHLYWRFEIMRAIPNVAQPGAGAPYRVGQIRLDAVSGEVDDADTLAAELRAFVKSITPS